MERFVAAGTPKGGGWAETAGVAPGALAARIPDGQGCSGRSLGRSNQTAPFQISLSRGSNDGEGVVAVSSPRLLPRSKY